MYTAENYGSPKFDLKFLEEKRMFSANRREVEIGDVSIFGFVDRVEAEHIELRVQLCRTNLGDLEANQLGTRSVCTGIRA